jgi:hypothetical protein
LSTPGSSGPAGNYATVTPSDTVNFAETCRGLWVGTGGNVVCVRPNGTAVTFVNVPDGYLLPVIAKRVNTTSTTASNIVALW